MAASLFGTSFATLASLAWIGSAASLAKMALDVKHGRKFKLATYRRGLSWGAIGGVAFGVWTIFRVAVMLGAEGKAQQAYQGELMSLVIFWILMPPGWFFLEYYGLDSEAIEPAPFTDKDQHLEKVRVYADYASKIWAALSALLIGVAAIVFGK